MPKFNIGDFAKEKKRLRQQIVMKNRGIKELEDELSVVALEKQNKTKELSRMKAKCQRLDEKVLNFVMFC
jgi:septal ring factor EnvC (AmiA/AmiB activator)